MQDRGTLIRHRKLPLWEPKWSHEEFLRRIKEVTYQEFERGYRQRPFSEEDRLFSISSIADSTRTSLSVSDVENMNGPCFAGVDIATGKRAGTAFFVFKAIREGNRYIRIPVDIRVGEFKGIKFIQQFLEIEARWHPQIYEVENNSTQERILDLLSVSAVGNLPLEGFYTGKQKMDIDIGLPSLAAEFQNDLWAIPWQGRGRRDNPPDGHGNICNCAWCRWYYDELYVYPMAESSDILMAMWFAREGFRKNSGNLDVFEITEGPAYPGRFNYY